MFGFQFLQASEKVGTEFEAVLLGLFLLDDFEHGLADGGNNGVATEGVEVSFLRHDRGDFRRGDDRGEWSAVADALGQRDDVGDDALRLEAPEMRAGAAEAGLDFVGDAETAGGAHVFVGVLEVALGEFDEAAHALDGLGEERGDFSGRRIVDEIFDIVGVFHAGLGVAVAEVSAVRIRSDRVVDAGGMGRIEFPDTVGGKAHRGGAAAVVAIAERDGVVVAGGEARHEQCEVVGLGAGVDEINDLEIPGHFPGEFFGEGPNVGVEVNRGGVLERGVLGVGGGEDVRVAVADADGHNAAEAVEVAFAGGVPDVLHFALHDHERLLIVEEKAGVEELFALREHLIERGTGVGLRLMRGGRERD